MSGDMAGRFGLGTVDQVSFVVADMDRVLAHYEAVFGPFSVAEAPLPDCTIRGLTADCKLKVAVNNAGPCEIELIQVLEGEPPHAEHLRAHGEGLHHVRFRVQGLEAKLEELGEAGFETIFFKRFGPAIAFAYLETPAALGRSVIELLEMP